MLSVEALKGKPRDRGLAAGERQLMKAQALPVNSL